MYVKSILLKKENLITITPDDNIKIALEKMESKSLQSIPVLDRNKFLGSISKQAIYEYAYSNRDLELQNVNVSQLVRSDYPKVSINDDIELPATFLETHNIEFVPVFNDYSEFVGIITHKTVFRMLNNIFGINNGTKLSIVAHDIPGQIQKITKIISENRGNILSFVVTDQGSKLGYKEIVMRIQSLDNMHVIIKRVQEAGFKIQ